MKFTKDGITYEWMPKYRIKVYVPVEPMEDSVYKDYDSAMKEKQHLESLQPENLYVVEKIDE